MTPAADGPAGAPCLIVNGEPMTLSEPTTLSALVTLVVGDQRGIAVAVDGDVVPRSEWTALTLGGGARVEIVTAAAGG